MITIVTNPKNRELLEQAVAQVPAIIELIGVRFRFDEHLPARRIRQTFTPPTSRFVEYGPEDETWLQWAGLGIWTTVDEGPLFYSIDESLCGVRIFDRVDHRIVEPRYFAQRGF